jgi:dihydrofolate reductase
MVKIALIAAVSNNNCIGKEGQIPWNIPEDRKHFKEITWGYPVIMGRKTYESLPVKPLLGRENIVLSRDFNYAQEGILIFDSFQKALEHCTCSEKVFVCGGEEIYRETIRLAHTMYITKIHEDIAGDRYFPDFNENEWDCYTINHNNNYSLLVYRRRIKNANL